MKIKAQKTLDKDWETHVRNLALPLMTWVTIGKFLWEVSSDLLLCPGKLITPFLVLLWWSYVETFAILQWLAYTSFVSTNHEFLEGRNLIFLLDSELHESKDHGRSCVPLNPPSPAQPWHTADFQGLGTASSSAQHDLCLSIPMTHLHSRVSSVRLLWPPTLSILLLVTLTSPLHHPFYLFVVFVNIWHCLIWSPVSCLLSFPLRPETTWGQGVYQFCSLLYLQHLEKCLVHKYLLNEWTWLKAQVVHPSV